MRHLRHTVLALAALALAPAISFGQVAMIPGAGLTGSIHDFVGGVGTSANTQAVGLCTFCHTPHPTPHPLPRFPIPVMQRRRFRRREKNHRNFRLRLRAVLDWKPAIRNHEK